MTLPFWTELPIDKLMVSGEEYGLDYSPKDTLSAPILSSGSLYAVNTDPNPLPGKEGIQESRGGE